jgi:hypothetical protein
MRAGNDLPRNSRSKRFARSQNEGLQPGTLQNDWGHRPTACMPGLSSLGSRPRNACSFRIRVQRSGVCKLSSNESLRSEIS